ncbi:hypothetical protein PQX77_014763 [Marasmius sp. AFHP31]|nr:hypothetical protein PQX77_014763 [Marasmius sp. AFHP31]
MPRFGENIIDLDSKAYHMQTEQANLERLHDRLVEVLEEFRHQQSMVTPYLPERLLGGKAAGVEGFTLGLPSDMTTDEREEYGATKITFQEGNIWTSCMYNLVNALQNTCHKLKILCLFKLKSISTEDMQTRTGRSIQNVIEICNCQLAMYDHNRQLLVHLCAIKDDSQLPLLTVKDTECKNVMRKPKSRGFQAARWGSVGSGAYYAG